MTTLSIHDHNRTVVGYTYIYPVVSRRAGGVSVGINLNPNNACNWACVYCQVPNLTRGNAPEIDVMVLENELREFLKLLTTSDWLTQNAPEEARVLQDIAFSGNGEPTSAKAFPEVVNRVGQVLRELDLLNRIKVRLITNGSQMYKATVLDAMASLAAINGEVWFKIDRATPAGMSEVNGVEGDLDSVRRRLLACAQQCPTWIQTCWFARDGQPPSSDELSAYLALVDEVKSSIQGVHLYGIARPSYQPGAERLSQLPETELFAVGEKIRALGVEVHVSL